MDFPENLLKQCVFYGIFQKRMPVHRAEAQPAPEAVPCHGIQTMSGVFFAWECDFVTEIPAPIWYN